MLGERGWVLEGVGGGPWVSEEGSGERSKDMVALGSLC